MANNGSTSLSLNRFEGAKIKGMEIANEAARRKKPEQLGGPAPPNSKPI